MKDGYKVKICGTTNMQDVLLTAGAGADYFGVVIEVDFSPRSLTIEEAGELFINPPIPAVALVFNMEQQRIEYLIETLSPFAIQFLSQDSPKLLKELKKKYPSVRLWQSIHLPKAGSDADIEGIKKSVNTYLQAGVDLLLFDTVATVQGVQKFGGTGQASDWKLIKQLINDMRSTIPVLLAGGITPQNVSQALGEVNPYGVDLCSGVEAEKGKKDPEKVMELMRIVKTIGNYQCRG